MQTALWNPSSDVDTPNHAFRENAAALLTQLSYIYDIYIIVHVNSEEERESIKVLLENAGLFTSNQELDNRKVIFCQEEEGKIHIIRHIEPFIHIEGGWEKDDGEDIVKKLRPFVHKIVWVITKRRRDSFKPGRISEADKSILGHNVEVSELLLTSSIAREALGKQMINTLILRYMLVKI